MMRKDQNGYLVIETLGTFIPLVLIMVTILSFINLMSLRSQVHYAITQTASELSMYSYVLKPLGLLNDLQAIDKAAEEGEGIIDDTVDYVSSVSAGITGVVDSGTLDDVSSSIESVINGLTGLSSTATSAINDPMEYISPILNFGINTEKNELVGSLITPFLEKHLKNGDIDADTALRNYGVVDGIDGISLSGSSFIDQYGDITIVATYDVEYDIGWISLGTLTITQTAKTRAWIGATEE